MELKIRSVDFIYDTNGIVVNVNLRFETYQDDSSLNGFVRVTVEEYNPNATDLPALSALALTKIKEKLNAGV